MTRIAGVWLGLLVSGAVVSTGASCGSEDAAPRLCVPGRTVKCVCDDGGDGLQSCLPDGSGYDACAFCKTKPPPGIEAGFSDVTGQVTTATSAGPCLGFDDFDGDGDFDMIMGERKIGQSGGVFSPGQLVIYANLGDGRFSTTPAVKLADGVQMLCTVSDFDRDGKADIVAAVSQLDGKYALNFYKNLGKFAFQADPTVFNLTPIDDAMLLAMGSYDYNNDGWLDVVIGRSRGGGPANADACKMLENDFVCESTPYPNQSGPLLYHNQQGKFVLVPGVFQGPFPGTTNAVAFADLDGNGLTDMFMANDWFTNLLQFQTSPGVYQRAEPSRGLELFNHGMGIGINDFDLDGHGDVYVADLGPSNFWFGKADGTFENLNAETGVSAVTRYHSNWAVVAEDFNLNGLPDIFVASSGLVTNEEDMVKMALVSATPYTEVPPQLDLLFWNRGNREFAPVALPHRPGQKPAVILGTSATADVDGDGDLDLVTAAGDGMQMRFLRNEQPPGNYLALELVGTKSNPHGIGAVVQLMKGGKEAQRRYVGSGGSVGVSWRLAHFGLAADTGIDEIRIRWPAGGLQTLTNVEANQILRVTEP